MMNVSDLFSSLRGLIKTEEVCTDNTVFRLHYKATVILLSGFTILISASQYFGDPIDCISNYDNPRILDNYCWIHSTFTVLSRLEGEIGVDFVRQGVSPYEKGVDQIKYHRYYQWVCFALFFQVVCFHIPRYLWKAWEGGRIKMLVSEVNVYVVTKEVKDQRMEILVNYFTENLHMHNFYAYRFFACEVFNFVNVIAQVYFVNYFLDGEFSTYGLEVIKFLSMDRRNRIDPMSRVFPTLTKCNFYEYSPSGEIQTFDSICMLPVNIVNEKIYVILWFWFIALILVSGINLVYRFVVCFYPKIRLRLMRSRCLAPHYQIEYIVNETQIGDWLILYQIGKNMNPFFYRDLISVLFIKLKGKQWH